MTSAVLALHDSILTALRADSTLVGLLSGPKIYDEPPRTLSAPFVTFGDVAARDWSTSTEGGMEHVVSLNLWLKQGSLRSGLVIAGRISLVLSGVALDLSDHRLISLQLTHVESKYEDSGRWLRIVQRFRAVTEPNEGRIS